MTFGKTLLAALLAAGSLALADDAFTLKGNVQAQATKSIEDDDNNLSSLWFRANIGGSYTSENLDGLIMLRIFAPSFGNTIDGTEYDKILADLYWINYKWALGKNDQLNLKIGHWKTDWSQSTHFGTYIDKDLTKRGLWMRDQSHDALELGWKHGLSQLNLMVATSDSKFNTGYVRVEESMKFTFPLEVNVAYRTNAVDVIQNTSYLTHRVAARASYSLIPNLRLYGEFACLYTHDDSDVDEGASNYVNTQESYLEPGETIVPFYVGIEIPTGGILDHLMFEVEYIEDRDELSSKQPHADDLAWTFAISRKFGRSNLQFSVYSEEELNDVGLAFRLTSTIR